MIIQSRFQLLSMASSCLEHHGDLPWRQSHDTDHSAPTPFVLQQLQGHIYFLEEKPSVPRGLLQVSHESCLNSSLALEIWKLALSIS